MNTAHTTYALLATSMGFFVFTMITVGPALFAHAMPQQNTAQLSHVLAPNAFANVGIVAQSAVVYDVASQKTLFEKNANAILPLASITKVASALAVQQALSNITTVVVPAQALFTEGESGLRAGEQWNTNDLLAYSLVTSSNDGIEALSEIAHASVGTPTTTQMNRYAQQKGWGSFWFDNVTGLDVLGADGTPIAAGAVGSATDVAKLFAHALAQSPALYEATAETGRVYTSLSGIAHTADNTNTALGDLPGLVAGKTGFTDLAGGNLVVAFEPEPGRQIIIVVLGSTFSDRFTDTTTLAQRTLEHVWFEN